MRNLKNVYVEKFQKKLDCGATVTRFRETVLDEDEDLSLEEGVYFKDRLWDEES